MKPHQSFKYLELPSCPSSGSNRAGAVVKSENAKEVMIIGGDSNRARSSDTWLFNLGTHKWRKGPQIPDSTKTGTVTLETWVRFKSFVIYNVHSLMLSPMAGAWFTLEVEMQSFSMIQSRMNLLPGLRIYQGKLLEPLPRTSFVRSFSSFQLTFDWMS